MKWHGVKTNINNQLKTQIFYEREVWFCHLGENVGSEQDGKGDSFIRPVLIVKKFNNQVFWCLPITSSNKKNKYNCEIFYWKGKISFVILSQIRLLDAKRLKNKIRSVSKGKFSQITEKLKGLIP